MPTLIRTLSLLALLVAGTALAFEWEPLEFEARSQAYTLEMRDASGTLLLTLDIDIVANGDTFDVTTVQTSHTAGVDASDLDSAALGGGGGMMGFGGMMLFGSSFMMLPMVLASEEVAVRADPIEVPGFGTVQMASTTEVAGATCVDVRIVPDAEGAPVTEFGVAEGVPFPCYSRYGEGEDAIEIRLTRIE